MKNRQTKEIRETRSRLDKMVSEIESSPTLVESIDFRDKFVGLANKLLFIGDAYGYNKYIHTYLNYVNVSFGDGTAQANGEDISGISCEDYYGGEE